MKTNVKLTAAMASVLVIAYGLDRVNKWIGKIAEESFNFRLLAWVRTGSYLLLAIVIMRLAWLFIVRYERSVLSSSIFLGLGLLILFMSTPLFLVMWTILPQDQFPRTLFLLPLVGQMTARAGAFIAVIELIGFFPQIKRS